MEKTTEELLAEIRAECDDKEACGEQARTKTPYYRVRNMDPRVEYDENNRFIPGIVVDKSQPPVDSIRAVILYSSDGRKFQRKSQTGLETVCESFDGLTPAVRVKDPQCRKLDAAGVAAVLSAFKGYDKAKVESTVSDLTESTGKLQFCTMKARDGFIPICPKARFDKEEGKGGPCKPIIKLVGWDLDRQQVFKMDLSGGSIFKNERAIAPIREFRAWLGQKQVPYYHISVRLSAKKDGKFYILGVDDYQPIGDQLERAKLKAMADSAKQSYMKTATFIPSTEAEKAEASRIKSLNSFSPSLAEDEIPF